METLKDRILREARTFVDKKLHLAIPKVINEGTICEQRLVSSWLPKLLKQSESKFFIESAKAKKEVVLIMLAIKHFKQSQSIARETA